MDTDAQYDEDEVDKKTKLDFTNIHTNFCGSKVYVEFYFSDLTLGELAKTIGKMPVIYDKKKQATLIFGNTIDKVSLDSILNLARMSNQRIKLDLSGVDIDTIFRKSHKYPDYHSLEFNDQSNDNVDHQKYYDLYVEMFLMQQVDLIEYMTRTNTSILNIQREGNGINPLRWTSCYVAMRWPEGYEAISKIDDPLVNDEMSKVGAKQRFPQNFTFAKNFLADNMKLKTLSPTRFWNNRSLFFLLQDFSSM